MSQVFRLPQGGLIDRNQTLNFTFDGQSYQGFAGDTLASALLANGVSLVGRSFKYHRPRGILSAGPEEPNALVELREGARREPNTRATVAELFDGLVAQSQNRWPSLRYDLLSVNSLLSPFLGAGFYYKTFMWPASFWEKVYEPLIRRAAGLGKPPEAPDPDQYEKAHAFCDVLVIGAGPAGLMAALAAARTGARVILCEEDFALGGRLLSETRTIDGKPAFDWVRTVEAELAAMPDVRIFKRTCVFGVYDHGTYGAIERVNDHVLAPPEHEVRQRSWRIVAKRAVLAAGAIERPLVFGDNDRPGVMLAGAARTYLNRYAVKPGRVAAVFANNDDALRTVGDLHAAGVDVAAVIDPRVDMVQGRLAAEKAGARFVQGAVTRATGGQRVQGVEVLGADGQTTSIACDFLAMSGGWSPSVHLTSHLGGKPTWNDALAAFVPGSLPTGLSVAGAAMGDFALAACFADGLRLGQDAASAAGFAAKTVVIPAVDAESTAITPVWRVKGSKGKSFIDYQNDVTDKDVEIAKREGFRAVEHLKRYTTLGMATDQGKTANVNGLAIMAELTQKSIPETGTTRFRSPYTPVAAGALAGGHHGMHYKPTRLTPSHRWATELGAVFVEAGLWMRAQYFPQAGDKSWLDACIRETKGVRERVGVCDVSTLGKIDIQGPDAGVFLDRLYTNQFSTLGIGKVRYGLMLREDGFVMDDGTTARFGQNRYFMTTTTNNAVKVFQHMDFCHQALWPELDVHFVSATEQWAQFSIAGPHARDVLRGVVDAEHDLSNEAFPYMACGEMTALGGLPARVYRISFSGEMAYEIGMPARYGDALIRAIMAAGKAYGITPYGIEALVAMRIEKGHLGGGELDGRTTAADLGLGKMMSKKKDFIGRALAGRTGLTQNRQVFVGLKPVDKLQTASAGAHLFPRTAATAPENDQGHVTSAGYSPSLGQWIALGLIARGTERYGEIVLAHDPIRGRDVLVEICSPHFLDPEGTLLRV
ncbi:sarcosine oxidase subunit alpha family protein [Methylovirgula sp. 4M-Z18]|uniref:sarcosine oxidase subunit alpha family protein n=1 Tax=Methylovirgula sp. 4M-Z18 TaxID=2293567 RepID=UPI000E2F1284|nr:sarcosine oxidase subunit alpha family protein [Methylovirgula sp. 4M-Z18]RFB79369.1 sarcosine oxidase subunit alpha family protein [Methylovirgula sp. 4M-Z18]